MTLGGVIRRVLGRVSSVRMSGGQLKGGAAAARRMSTPLTCFLTWGVMGNGVVAEVMRAV